MKAFFHTVQFNLKGLQQFDDKFPALQRSKHNFRTISMCHQVICSICSLFEISFNDQDEILYNEINTYYVMRQA